MFRLMHSDDQDEVNLLERARVQGGYLLSDLITELAQAVVKELSEAMERGRN